MIDAFPFAGLPVAVFGLGRSGLSAARALNAAGADVWAWDDAEDSRARAEAAGVSLVDLYGCNWSALTSLVLAPGVPMNHPRPHPVVDLARRAGCEVARLHLRHIRPLPNSLAATIGRFEQVLVPEMNMGQLSRILAAEIPANYLPMNKVTGRPFTNREIREKVQEVLR